MKTLLKEHLCYLSGAIDRAKDSGKSWRKEIRPFLQTLGIRVIDPTDSPFSDTDDSVAVARINKAKESKNWTEAAEIAKEVVQRDLRAVDLSSFLIVYYDPDVHVCGTVIEIAHAAMQRKPVLVCCPKGKEHVPNFLWGMLSQEMFFDSWELLQNYLVNVHIGAIKNSSWKFIDFNKV